MFEFADGFGFDLANALAGNAKGAADFFQSARPAVFQAKAHDEDLFLAVV